MNPDESASPFAPPPTEFTGTLEPAATSPLSRAFRPLERAGKICGRIVELQLGDRRISLPSSYACEDKNEEFENAPAAANSINVPILPEPP